MTEKEKNNEDFISKEFVVKSLLFRSGGVEEYKISKFMKSLDCEVEIENKGGKRVKATSFFKIILLGIRYKDKFTIYCYGENQEKNLKKIEEFFKGIEVYPIEEIK
ncbi:HPr family phosphocarrier protein [Brachyspira aalborgi]|uniref:HPr family phosphocarrier protein n=1 Tax=Brachyspira aalborgi TaxID=29522 RepID=A0A5C8CDC8_9SPIR|nr:HPr family phosphocarrier protein [Brachyspira aalborgi]TXJ10918.1 HPr family phosphocarrier protein [Brachyspira aalborgi]